MSDVNMNSYVEKQYQKLKKIRDDHERIYMENLYEAVPQIKNIDNEISLIALRCATRVINEGITPDEAIVIMNKKRDELLLSRKELLKGANYPEYTPIPYECSLCGDTGRVGDKLCSCYRDRLRKYMIDNAKSVGNFSCDIQNDTFDNFRLDYYSAEKSDKFGISPRDNMKSILTECRRFCDSFGENSDNIFFNGTSGLGKTFLANCIANELLSKGHSVIYQTSHKMFQFLEDYKFSKIDREEYRGAYNAIYDCDLLIIDDLGTEFVTSYTCSVLFDVINSRLLNNKKTLISTNLTVKDIAKTYSERVSSRIIGDFSIHYFFGSDIRIQKRNSSF